jgi:ketosteroid isomerase-like protein
MSQENVELVQDVVEASQRGEMDKVFAAYDPEIEWRIDELPTVAPDSEPVYHGHEGVRRFWRTWAESFETPTFQYEEFIDAGDTVISILSQHVRGRGSGIELEWNSYAQNWTIKDGIITRVEFFPERAQALAAAGLPSSARAKPGTEV